MANMELKNILHIIGLLSLPEKFLFNPLSVNPTKWSNTLKQFVGKLPTNSLSVSDHFVGLSPKGLKIASATFLLVSFICLKEGTHETRENVFLFQFESSFCSRDNQVLTFQVFKFHDVIKSLSMKHKTHLLNKLRSKHSLVIKFSQFM